VNNCTPAQPVDFAISLAGATNIALRAPMSELCGNPAAETGEALMPSELFIPLNLGRFTDFPKKSANSIDQEFASNVKLILGTW
jgi:hypothetical protein